MEDKQCNKCYLVKAVINFYKDKSKSDGLNSKCKSCCKDNNKKYYQKNKITIKSNTKERYDNNSEEQKEYQKEYRKTNSNKLALYEDSRKDRKKEQDSLRYKSKREEFLDYSKNYRVDNREKMRARDAEKRAWVLNATPDYANLENIDNIYKEARELELKDGIPRHVDHIIPLRGKSVCGLHVEQNLQILTATENMKKSNTY
jgi:hypothetical protein